MEVLRYKWSLLERRRKRLGLLPLDITNYGRCTAFSYHFVNGSERELFANAATGYQFTREEVRNLTEKELITGFTWPIRRGPAATIQCLYDTQRKVAEKLRNQTTVLPLLCQNPTNFGLWLPNDFFRFPRNLPLGICLYLPGIRVMELLIKMRSCFGINVRHLAGRMVL